MLLFATTVAAAVSAQPLGDMPVVNPKTNQPASCPATSRYEASGKGKMPKAQRLDQLPDADVYRSVYRRIGRCEAPIIVKFGVAGG